VDAIYLILTVAMFALLASLVRGADRL